MKNLSSRWVRCGTAVALIVAGGILPAQADISWEHRLTLRASKTGMPVQNWKIFNNWSSSGRHRLLVKIPLSAFGGVKHISPLQTTALPASTFSGLTLGLSSDASTLNAAHTLEVRPSDTASLAVITRLDDDRLLAYFSPARQYISEPLRDLLKKLRFDPWKKLHSKLDGKPVPQLSEEQRERLGQEVRDISRPMLKKVWKVYFRALPQTRTFEGVEGHGFRLTMLVNTGDPRKNGSAWARVNWEWWLADEMDGDELVRDFRSRVRQIKTDIGPSTSMWLNETMPVLWQMLPEELHQAVETVVPPSGSPHAGFGGTPIRFYFTVLPPPMQRAAMGDIRAEVALLKRDTKTLPASVFEAPGGFERMPLEPQLKQYEGILEGAIARTRRQADELGMSFNALESTSRQLPLLMFAP